MLMIIKAKYWSHKNKWSRFDTKGQRFFLNRNTQAAPWSRHHASDLIWRHEFAQEQEMPICPCNMLQTFNHPRVPETVLFKENRFPAHIIIFLILSQCQPSAITPCQLCIVVLFSLACVSMCVRGSVDWWLRVWRRGGLKRSKEDNVERSKNINLKLIL